MSPDWLSVIFSTVLIGCCDSFDILVLQRPNIHVTWSSEENDSTTDLSINFSLYYACVIKGEKNIPTFCCLFFHSNNNRNSRKMAGKKFQPLSQEVSERSDIPDGSYSCSPSKQGPLRLKLSSKLLCFTLPLLTLACFRQVVRL